MAALAEALAPLKYEYELFHRPHRLQTGPAFKCQRLLRHLLNMLTVFACSMDAQRTTCLGLGEADCEKMRRVAEQVQHCLDGLAWTLQGRVQVEECVDEQGSDWEEFGLFLCA